MSQYDAIYADPRKWLREGWVDYLAPQLYWPLESRGQPFEPLLAWWRDENVLGRHVWPGLYTGRYAKDGDQIPRQVAASRRILAAAGSGHIHFSAIALAQNRFGIADGLAPTYARAALMPEMRWLGGDRPPPPRARLVGADHDRLEIAVEPASLAHAAAWVVQVERGGQWDHAVVPAARARTAVALPGSAGPPGTVTVFAVGRLGAASERVLLLGDASVGGDRARGFHETADQ
jgi:hypothetical protein